MRYACIVVVGGAAFLAACASTEEKAAPAATEAQAAASTAAPAEAEPSGADGVGDAAAGAPVVRGEAVTIPPEQAVTLAAIAADPEAFAGKTVRIDGKVEKVCAKKGCWLALADGSGAEPVRVTMKDYGFFVPTDCVGKAVTVQGKVELREVSVEEQVHFAKDEGREVDPATLKPVKKVSIVASGVELRS
ncbi:MAG: DUF4920 domain-containing protein [Deltaproteobacteria bacterium]|nr:MAG: DUF4920 domain-containing protein [Deltaproteobacteria bacterium]